MTAEQEVGAERLDTRIAALTQYAVLINPKTGAEEAHPHETFKLILTEAAIRALESNGFDPTEPED